RSKEVVTLPSLLKDVSSTPAVGTARSSRYSSPSDRLRGRRLEEAAGERSVSDLQTEDRRRPRRLREHIGKPFWRCGYVSEPGFVRRRPYQGGVLICQAGRKARSGCLTDSDFFASRAFIGPGWG